MTRLVFGRDSEHMRLGALEAGHRLDGVLDQVVDDLQELRFFDQRDR